MIQYTTVTLPVRVKNLDLTGADHIWMTLSDPTRGVTITKDSPTAEKDGADTLVTATFSQAETARFTEHSVCDGMINFMFGTARGATQHFEIDVYENLLKEILP